MPGTKNLRCSWNESGERGLTSQPTFFFREDVKKLIFFVIEDVQLSIIFFISSMATKSDPQCPLCVSLTYLNVHHVQYQNCLWFHYEFQAILRQIFNNHFFLFFVWASVCRTFYAFSNFVQYIQHANIVRGVQIPLLCTVSISSCKYQEAPGEVV